MKVVLFQRRPPKGAFSIENITQNILTHLPKNIEAELFVSSFLSQGLLNRLKAIWEAKQHQGDVNHITGDVHFLSFLLHKKRTILTIHDCERLMSEDYHGLKKMIYKFFWFTWPCFCSEIVTTISQESKKNLIKYADLDSKKMMIIPDGIDDRFKPMIVTEDEKKILLKNPLNKKTVLHVSGTKKNKNVARLLEALVGLDIKFVKVGAMTLQEKEFIQQHHIDTVFFENISVEALVRIYHTVDCLVFPSLIEGFGMPVVEAQRCGCPVVTSNISSLPEVAGEGALLVDPFSVKEMRQGIVKILEDDVLRKHLIQQGFENAKKFTWDLIAQQYTQLYRQIAEGMAIEQKEKE